MAHQLLGVILHIVEHLFHRFAVDDLVDVVCPILHRDVHGIGIAEEVVHVAEDFLVGPHEEHAEIVVFVFLHPVHRQHMSDVTTGHEVGNLSVAVAGDILQGGIACGSFGEPLYGHDGEELVDGPRVGQRLEEREVTEILIGQQLVEVLQFLRHMFERLGDGIDFAAHAPVHALNLRPCFQVNQSV